MRNIKLFVLSAFLFVGFGLRAETEAVDAAVTTLNIVGGSNTYKIVYESGDATAKSNATELQTAIKNKTGKTLSLATDASSATSYEIILGPYNSRSEHTTVKNGLGKPYGYRIMVVGKKLVITATDNNHMVCALKRFETAILKSSTLAGSGKLNFSTTNEQHAVFEKTQATLAAIISNGYGYSLSSTQLFKETTFGTSSTYVSQGACNDGTYFYIVHRNKSDNASRLYKYRMSDNTRVKYSGTFDGNHSNDLTYDHKNKRLVLVHGSGAANKLEFFDPSTLKSTGSKTVGRGVGALAYCKERDEYAGSQGGNCIFFMPASLSYDSSNKKSRSASTEGSSGYTAQGMGCDEDYVYFPMSKSGKNNILLAYDWNGNFKKKFTLPGTTLEGESLSECNGIYYFNCHKSSTGTYMFRLNITLKYTSGI